MPIGTSKVGALGGLVPGGTETFNAPGTFSVPPGVKKVSITGKGGTGNPGNPGNPGNAGNAGGGGGGGGGGNFDLGGGGGQGPQLFKIELRSNPQGAPLPGGAQGGNTVVNAPGNAGQTGQTGSGGSAGNAGNAGTAGNSSSGLGNTFPGGAGGNAGAAGNAGTAGSGGGGGGGGQAGTVPTAGAGGTGGTGAQSGNAGGNNLETPIRNPFGCPAIQGGQGGGGAGSSGNAYSITYNAITTGGPPCQFFRPGTNVPQVNSSRCVLSRLGGAGSSFRPWTFPSGGQASYNYGSGTPSTNATGCSFFEGGLENNTPPSIVANTSTLLGRPLAPFPANTNIAIFRFEAGSRNIGPCGSSNKISSFFSILCAPQFPFSPWSNDTAAQKANAFRGGGGGGFGALGGFGPTPAPTRPRGSGGGGGGGRGAAGNPGGTQVTGGSGSPATPQTFNCVTVTPGATVPITVASPGGQIVISWNPQ